MIIDIETKRKLTRHDRDIDDLTDLQERVVMWRNELLDTVPFNGRRIQLLDQMINHLDRMLKSLKMYPA